MSLDFTAVDFETANNSSASACAVGLVRVRDGVAVEREEWLMKPPPPHEDFAPFHVRLHGVTPEMVATAPEWGDRLRDIVDFVGSDIVVAHNAGFDMGVIRSACAVAVEPTPRFRYVCSVQVSRKTYDLPSYSLPYAAAAAGFTAFTHHNALADSEACAAIIVDAARRVEATNVQSLARALQVRIRTLKAAPLKLSH